MPLSRRNPLVISQSVAVDRDVVATRRAGASALIDDRCAAVHARPGEDRGFAAVACDPAAEFGLVASEAAISSISTSSTISIQGRLTAAARAGVWLIPDRSSLMTLAGAGIGGRR